MRNGLEKNIIWKMFDSFCKMGIDPFGEKGEFHTTVIDADIFKVSLLDKLKMRMREYNYLHMN